MTKEPTGGAGDEAPPAELMAALDEEEGGTGARRRATFGIGKTMGGNVGMSRTVVRFSRPPRNNPLSLCCNLPGGFVGHRFMLDSVREKLADVTAVEVTTPSVACIQYQDRNVIMGSQGLLNRWIITVNCPEARDELLRVGLFVLNKKVGLRRYDEVLAAEYKEYRDYMAAQKKLFAKLEPTLPSDHAAASRPSLKKVAMLAKTRGRVGDREPAEDKGGDTKTGAGKLAEAEEGDKGEEEEEEEEEGDSEEGVEEGKGEESGEEKDGEQAYQEGVQEEAA